MALAIYLLFHEKEIMGTTNPKKLHPVSVSKAVGEKKSRDLSPYELQRQRIKDETVFKFESTQRDEVFELREDELQEFDNALKVMKGVRAITPDTDDGLKAINSKKEKEYYEVE